jgi:4-amino-4-deoxy-L-arabinose transferase-like glycosyltransferase
MTAPSLLLVAMLWYWVGSRLDRRWSVSDKTPWIALLAFTVVSLAGALVRFGHVDYLSYGFIIWVIVALTISRFTRTCSGIPTPDLNSKIHHS